MVVSDSGDSGVDGVKVEVVAVGDEAIQKCEVKKERRDREEG